MIDLSKEQQIKLIQANKIFKLKMLKDYFTEEQAKTYEDALMDLFPFVMLVECPIDFDNGNGLYKWIVGC